jgi:poly-beta-1,6-N-acetyl-D-glucosamine synthase
MLVMTVAAGTIAYSYIGYPTIAWIVSRTRRGRRRPPIESTAPVTVIISAYQEADVIEDKIRSTLGLSAEVARLQIVVAVDGDDPTVDAARRVRDDRVEILHHPTRRGKSAAMADAVARADGDIVVFTDANAEVQPGSFAALTAWFGDPEVGVVSGAKQVASPDGARGDDLGEGAYWRYESKLKQWETRAGTTVAVVGELLAIRRSLVPVIPADIVNDDFFLAMHALRAGYAVVYEPDARTIEAASPSLESERHRRRRIVAGRSQAGRMWSDVLPYRRPIVLAAVVSHKYTRPLVPWAAIAGMAAALAGLVRPTSRRESTMAGVVLTAALLVLGAAAAAPMLPARPRAVRRAAAVCRMLTSANVATAQGTLDDLRGRTTALWPRVTRTTLS